MPVSTCQYRYLQRKEKWIKSGVSFPRVRHHFWWLLHNLVSHPLLAIPTIHGVWFHDWTSKKLNRKPKFIASTFPNVSNWKLWILHNVLLHIAIAIVPCKTTFEWHDNTATQMDVEDWV